MPRLSLFVVILGFLLITVFASSGAQAADNGPLVTFNIKDGEIVKLDDFLLVAEVNEDLKKTYDQFKLLIDGKQMDAKYLAEQGILTFLPGEGFDVGQHLIQLIGVKGDTEETLNQLGFGAVMKDLDKFISGELKIEDAILALGGELVVNADINELDGVGKDILIRDPREALTQLATKIATDKWGLDVMMLADSRQGKYTQFYDRLKVGYSQDELNVNFGETFPKFSDYTIKGRRLQGFSWADNLGDSRFEGAWGQALRRTMPTYDSFGGIDDPGSPALDIYTVRFGLRDEFPFHMGATLLGGRESNYGPVYEFPGGTNQVVSFDMGYKTGKDFSLDGEYAMARNKDEISATSTNGNAKNLSLNYNRGDNKLALSYRDVEPTFDSYGLNSVRTDVRGFKVDDRFNFSGRVTGNLSYEKYRDNLDGSGNSIRWTKSIAGRMTYRPKVFPGGFDFTYRNYNRSNSIAPGSSGAYDVSTDSMTFSGFVKGDFLNAKNQLRVSYTDRSSDDAIHTGNGSDSTDITVIWSARFGSGMGVNASYGVQKRSAESTSDRNCDHYDISVNYPIDRGRIVLIGAFGYNSLDADTIDGGSNRINARFALRWKFTQYYYIEASYQRLDYDNDGNSALSYDDDAFNVKLVSTF